MEHKSGDINVLEVLRHDFHFPGHLLPGTAFILMGFWWIYNALRIHYSREDLDSDEYPDCEGGPLNVDAGVKYGSRKRARTIFTATYNGEMPGLLYCEGFYKLIYATLDLLCHLWVLTHGGNPIVEGQHMTIYLFFILESLLNILTHTQVGTSFPPGAELFLSGITWSVFGYLFLSHKHGKDAIQIYYHSVLAWIAVSVGVASLLQAQFQEQLGPALGRGLATVLAGTWLYQIALTFHNPWNGVGQGFMGTGDEITLGIMQASSRLSWDLLGILGVVGGAVVWLSRDKGEKGQYCRVRCC